MDEVFGLTLSQGALANMLKRSHQPFEAAKQGIVGTLRQAEVVASPSRACEHTLPGSGRDRYPH
jgi:hypothetical protein